MRQGKFRHFILTSLLSVSILNTGCLRMREFLPLSSTASTEVDDTEGSTCPKTMRHASPFAGGDGSAGNPWLICNATQFEQIANHLSGNFKLASDVDFTGKTHDVLGSDTNRFTGTLNGDGYAIKNWTVNSPNQVDTSPIALFHTIDAGAVINNLDLKNFDLQGNNFVAGLVYTLFGTVNNMKISGSFKTRASAAGIATYAFGSTIQNCTTLSGMTVYSSGDGSNLRDFVTPGQGSDMGIAGFVSMAADSSGQVNTFDNLINHATITWNPSGYTLAGWVHTGGIISYPRSSNITNVTNYGAISAVDEAGGIAGLFENFDCIMDHALNFGNVTGRDCVAGLAANGTWGAEIHNSWTGGTITGRDAVGGIYGCGGDSGGVVAINSASHANVLGRSKVGGVAGHFNGTMTDVLAMASVTGNDSAASDYIAGVSPFTGGTISNVIMNQRNFSIFNGSFTQADIAFIDHYGSTISSTFYVAYGTVPGWGNTYASTGVATGSMTNPAQYAPLDFSVTGPWAMGSSTVYFDGTTHPLPRWMCALPDVTCL